MSGAAVAAVAIGSAIGGAARYALGLLLAPRSAEFPLGTLLVNVTGAFALGLFVRAFGEGAPLELRLLLTIGLCGGFTTFSTFSLETVRLLQDDAIPRALAYAGASVVLSVVAVWLGLLAGRALTGGARL